MSAAEQPLQRAIYPALPREAVEAIAALFAARPHEEPYSPSPEAPVFRVDYRGETGNFEFVLWPALRRVDLACGPHTWIARDVTETEVIPGLEVIFRFGDGGLLTAALGGQVLMVGGAKAGD